MKIVKRVAWSLKVRNESVPGGWYYDIEKQHKHFEISFLKILFGGILRYWNDMIGIAKIIKLKEILCSDATSILFIYLVDSPDIIGGAPARCYSVDLKRNASLSRVDICLGRHNDTDTLHITTCSIARNNSSVPFRWQNNRHPRLHLGHCYPLQPFPYDN